jgi:predicted Zn-dependent peptidase
MKKALYILLIALIGTSSFVTAQDSIRYHKETLPNGLTVIVKQNPDSRVFGVDILGKNRCAWENPGQEGITDFVNRMLTRGTKDMNAEQIQATLDDIGAQITTNDDPHLPYDDRYTWRAFSFIKFQTIDEYAEDGIKLLSKIVSEPSFPPEEIELTKKQVMGILGMESSSTNQVCRNLFYGTLLKDHPFGQTVLGNRASVGTFNQADLLLHHKKYYNPSNMVLAIVSNIEPATVMKWVKKRFGKIPPYPAKSPVIAIPPKVSGVVEVNKPMEKEQIYIYLGNIVCGYKSPDAPALTLAVEILSSRLQLNLREIQGLAYSVGADVVYLGDFGWWVAAMGTGAANFDTAKAGILAEIEKLKTDTISQAELDKARNSMWGSSLMRNLSGVNQAYNMAFYEFIGVPYNSDSRALERLNKVTIADVQAAANKYLDTANYVLAYVGKVAEPK